MGGVQVATIPGWVRDSYTAADERRVAEIAVAIGAERGFDARLKRFREKKLRDLRPGRARNTPPPLLRAAPAPAYV